MSEKAVEWVERMSDFLKPDNELLRYITMYRIRGENAAIKDLNKAIVESTLLSIPWGYKEKLTWDMVERMVERLTVNAHEPKKCPYCGHVISYPVNEVWIE
jgi:hypothetical protein